MKRQDGPSASWEGSYWFVWGSLETWAWWSLRTGRIPWGLGCLKQHVWRTQKGHVIPVLSKNGCIVYLIIK